MFLFLFNFISFASITSFKDGQSKIKAIFNTLNAYKRNQSCHLLYGDIRQLVESMLKLDPVTFFQEMQRVNDKIFLFTFWDTFLSHWMFLCGNSYNQKIHKEFKDFKEQISDAGCNRAVANDMLFNFKFCLMRALAIYQGDKAQMLFEAKNFFDFQLKRLILAILSEPRDEELHAQIIEMDRNFRFYYLCIEKENLKLLLTKEFHMLKTSLETNDKDRTEMHTENMTFLAGILALDRSSLYGVLSIEDQSPEFIGYFLLMQVNLKSFLNKRVSVQNLEPRPLHDYLLKYLFSKIPIFENQVRIFPQFKLLKEFSNHFEDILSKEDLIELARTLFNKILLF
jgi:hypothetical protein